MNILNNDQLEMMIEDIVVDLLDEKQKISVHGNYMLKTTGPDGYPQAMCIDLRKVVKISMEDKGAFANPYIVVRLEGVDKYIGVHDPEKMTIGECYRDLIEHGALVRAAMSVVQP